MEKKEKEQKRKEIFKEPKVLASYNKKDLDEMIKPHGMSTPGVPDAGCGCGCGCGCGGI